MSSSTNPLTMFKFANVRLPIKAVRAPSRRLLAAGAGLLCLGLLTGCPQTPPPALRQPPPLDAIEKDLRFDTRYLDSLDGPRSARTQREMAILGQLKRLGMASPSGSRLKQPLDAKGPTSPSDSVFEHVNGGPLVGFPSRAAQLADIYRKIDSLKVLEHIPLTPH